ncbi:unnamed protein product [Prunus armeniaca]|uniref:Uncharacterized protein n=1 Tax=Prunus armeniaca TaxID=36596 RepID=A0A6J5V7K3_PRUAR|nr:unnamed protein product [Prunus armeniaca]
METIFRWSGEPPKYGNFGFKVEKNIKQNCVLLNSTTLVCWRMACIREAKYAMLTTVWVLYYHDPTHNNEIKSEDKEQQQQSEDVGNEEEDEEEEEEKEDVIVDSDYELSEEENGNKEAASRAQPRNDAPNVEYTQCFEEMNEMSLNEATWEILDDDEDSDRLPYDGDSSGGEEDGKKKTIKRK